MLEIKKSEKDIKLELNDYQLDEDDNIITPNSTWFLLRKEFLEQKMNEYNLKEGDILKIGRITIRIKAIKFKKNENEKEKGVINLDKDQNITGNEKEKDKKINKKIELNESQQNKACRICYLEEETKDNPLVQPCTCSGSMKYIHINCLKKWVNKSVFTLLESRQYCNIYQYKTDECELCKTKFPDRICHKGKNYDILEFYNDFTNCLIIESLTMDKMKNRYLYVVNLDNPNNKILIGRGHDSNVIFNDISVSRVHSILNVNKNTKKVFISDNNSKFGTLILVQTKNIILSLDLKLHIQIGRTYMEFLIKGPSNFFGCFGVSEKKNPDYYYLQNKKRNKFEHMKDEINFTDKYKEEIDMKKNADETVEKINEYLNLNTNPNLNEDNLEELLLTPLKSNNDKDLNEEKKNVNEKEKEEKEEKDEISIEIEDENNDDEDIYNKKYYN